MSWAEKTDNDLADEANRGVSGQGAIVEALRRHRGKVEALDRAATRLAYIGLALAAIEIVVASLQFWAALSE